MIRARGSATCLPSCFPSLVLALSLCSPSPGQERRAVTIDDYFRLKSVSAPRISPEGAWVAYTVRTPDYDEQASETSLWLTPTSGGEPLRMTAPGYSASRPRWSPDGKFLSFLADRNDNQTQVWVFDRRGGDAQPLTEVKQGVSSYDWSPNSSRLLLSIRDPESEDEDGEDEPEPWGG